MLVYLFRQRRTDDLALTTDVTGRNIPPFTPSTDWIFVEALDISKFELRGTSLTFKVCSVV